jgi:branched-chain amino acid transport system ATP-binding protein
MIAFFRLAHLADEPAGALSYGQQKLLDTAMAFMAGPRVVLLDEPAGGVNLTMLGDFRDRLQAYHAERNATFVVIEHQMEFVMTLCTRVLAALSHVEGKARCAGFDAVGRTTEDARSGARSTARSQADPYR